MQAPHRQSLPQLTAATATPLDCAYKHPRVKLDPAVALIEQASASGAGAKHHNMSFTPPAGTAKGPEQSPTGTIVRKLIQLSEVKQRHPEAAAVPTKTARSAECTSKHVKPTQAAAAGPVAIAHHAPPANQVQSARGTLQAGSSPAQQANSDKAQLPSSKTCKATTSDGSLQGVLQSRKRPSPQSLKHSGLTPLPERPAKAPCHKQRVRQHIHHNQGQHLAEQSDLSCLGSDTSQVYNRAGIPETANNAQKPVGDAQSGGSNTAAQYETQDIKLEPPTLPVASRQQVSATGDWHR